jgi:hypothetical protein
MRRRTTLLILAALIGSLVGGFHEWLHPRAAGATPGCFLTALQPPTATDNTHVHANTITTSAACSVDYYAVVQIETIDPNTGTFQPWPYCTTPDSCAMSKPNNAPTTYWNSGTGHTICSTATACVFTLQDRFACGAKWKTLVTLFNPHNHAPIFAQESQQITGCV